MRFQLKAMTPAGRVESLALQARDEAGARQQLEARGYTVLRVRERAGLGLRLWRKEAFPVVQFSQELIVLLKAGLPLVDAIDTLAEKHGAGAARGVLESIAAVLREGRPLSAALEQASGVFSALYVATVRASEKTSDLAQALSRYVAYQERVDMVRRRVSNASIYPLLLLGVGLLVSLFLLLYVVPRFSHIYEDRGADLPLLSQALLAWGRVADGHAGLVLGMLGALVIAVIYAARQPAVRLAVHGALWRLPATGERLKLYQLARFYRTVGMLLGGGMPLVTSLEMCAQLLHPVVRAPLSGAIRSVAEGRSVSESMQSQGLTTPVALRMLAVGERGGNMAEMMERIAAFHDEEMTRWVERFTRLFEPALMTAIGLVIGTIVILMYMPIFELAGSLR
jgi:general secretion pathway protein F